MKNRADVELVARGLAPSREKAQAYIIAGRVYIGEKRVDKASCPVSPEDDLSLRGEDLAWASRGAHKLEKAITAFHADVAGLVAMDIGAASGGFTDVLLRHGARHVYAIDVGYGQLEWRLRQDERVTVMERTNARALTPDMFNIKPTLTVMDVSFISIKLILPAAISVMGEEGRFLTLIKPQFEAGRGQVGKNGVVRDAKIHISVLQDIRDFAASLNWQVRQLTYSPIKGPKGNIEFLADIVKGDQTFITDGQIVDLVAKAHQELAE
ncbi:MAG: TlyA family RNA methyltransferase [Bacillota bacterium]|nr:TlyA family RNA methyltransferase [Bacillota bacterium]